MEETETEIRTGTTTGLGILMFAAGAMIGAGLALLYAPKTGRELRDRVTDMTGDAMSRLKEFSSEAQEKMRSTISRGKEMAEEKASRVSGEGEAGREIFH